MINTFAFNGQRMFGPQTPEHTQMVYFQSHLDLGSQQVKANSCLPVSLPGPQYTQESSQKQPEPGAVLQKVGVFLNAAGTRGSLW